MDNQVFNRLFADLGQISTQIDPDWSSAGHLKFRFLDFGPQGVYPV